MCRPRERSVTRAVLNEEGRTKAGRATGGPQGAGGRARA